MKNWLLGIVLATLMMPALADRLIRRDDVPERYVVVPGDTLWDIATTFLEDPWRWQDIWYQNPQVENPDLIFPGDVLGLRMVDGREQLTVLERGEDTLTLTEDMADDGVVRLSPRVRVEALGDAIPTIPRERISAFLNNNQVLTQDTLEDAAYVVGGEEGRLVLGAGDRLFARGEWADEGSVYEVFRRGERYYDEETDELLGIEAISLGLGELELRQDDIARLHLTQSRQNIRVSDRLTLLQRESPPSVYFPSVPDNQDIRGSILNVADGGGLIGQYDVVLISRGAQDGLEEGHVLDIVRQGEEIRDPLNNDVLQLPGERAGNMMVFRVFDRLAYALVLDAVDAIAIGDQFQSPELSSLP